jgi:hypothetical protein
MLMLLEQCHVEVRREHLGGGGGGLCRLRGKAVMFVDLDCDAATQTESCLVALAALPDIEARYLPPWVRERIDVLRPGGVEFDVS